MVSIEANHDIEGHEGRWLPKDLFSRKNIFLPDSVWDKIIINVKGNKERELAYYIAAYCYSHPFECFIIPVNSLQYNKRTNMKTMDALVDGNIINRPYKGSYKNGASTYRFSNIKEIYSNLTGGYCSYDDAVRDKKSKKEQRFGKNISFEVREVLKNINYKWNNEAAFEVLMSFPEEKKIITFPYIDSIVQGKQNPSWKLTKTNRLTARRPALQNLSKKFRLPAVISCNEPLYDVDFIFQEGNIARVLAGKEPNLDLNDLLGERKKELKPIIQGILHGQTLPAFLYRRREEATEIRRHYEEEDKERDSKDWNTCYDLIKKEIPSLDFNNELTYTLQKTGSAILSCILNKAYDTNNNIVLPLHDGVLCTQRKTAEIFQEFFTEASQSVLSKSLPCRINQIPA